VSGPSFAVVVSSLGVIANVISLIVCRECPPEDLRKARLRYYHSSILQFIFDILYSSSLAVLFSASSSSIALPLVICWVWSNLSKLQQESPYETFSLIYIRN
jgi:hypothetical protein